MCVNEVSYEVLPITDCLHNPSSEYHSKILSYCNCCLESYKFVLFLFTPALNIGEGSGTKLRENKEVA